MQVESLIFHRRTGKVIPPQRSTLAEVDELVELPPLQQKIWRFMTYEKFADLIESRRLFCSRLDKLPDALEALLSQGNCRVASSVTKAFHNGYNIKEDRDQEILQGVLMRRLYFVNCWHINDSESRMMWRLYAPRAESVAIVSRVVKLCAYARRCEQIRIGRIIVSKVQYADFDYPRPDWVPWGPTLFKDMPYRIEREIRLVVSPNLSMERAANLGFFKIPLDPRQIIEAVTLHPHAYPGFCREVRELTQRRLPHAPVLASTITSRLW